MSRLTPDQESHAALAAGIIVGLLLVAAMLFVVKVAGL